MSIFHRAEQKPALTARGHLAVPANRSTTQAEEETPLKIRNIKCLGQCIQILLNHGRVGGNKKEKGKGKDHFCYNSNKLMTGSHLVHSRMSREDVYWDTERPGLPEEFFQFSFSQRRRTPGFSQEVTGYILFPKGLAIPHLWCDGAHPHSTQALFRYESWRDVGEWCLPFVCDKGLSILPSGWIHLHRCKNAALHLLSLHQTGNY